MKQNDNNYIKKFADKEVLITGGLGFIGSNIAHALVEAGARVTVLDALLPLYGGNEFNVDSIKERINVVIGDIRDEKLVNEVVSGKDFIFNLAAQVSYIDSITEPFLDLDINCLGHLRVLEAARKFAPKTKIVFSSSRLAYGKILTTPVDESHPTNPLSMYGVHKLAAEKYYRIYFDVYGIRSSVIRIPNPYGPRQQMKHSKYSIVGWFVRQAIEGKDIQVFGDGRQERDYLYVDDIVDAFLRIAASDRTDGEVYNIGTHERVCFVDMVDAILDVVGTGKKVHVPWPKNYERNETGNYIADTRKIKRSVGWEARVPLKEGVAKTVEYFKKNKDHYWQS